MVLMNMLIASSPSRQLSALLHDSEPALPFIGTVIDRRSMTHDLSAESKYIHARPASLALQPIDPRLRRHLSRMLALNEASMVPGPCAAETGD